MVKILLCCITQFRIRSQDKKHVLVNNVWGSCALARNQRRQSNPSPTFHLLQKQKRRSDVSLFVFFCKISENLLSIHPVCENCNTRLENFTCTKKEIRNSKYLKNHAHLYQTCLLHFIN